MQFRLGLMFQLAVMLASVQAGQAQITWRCTYGGLGSDQAISVHELTVGGYVIAGGTGSIGQGASDMYVVVVDEFGVPVWSRAYGGPGVETGISCRELSDGFIIAGRTAAGPEGGYDMMLIRTDIQGNPLWERYYGSWDWDLLNAMDLAEDGFILGGISYGNGWPLGSAMVLRTDMDGDVIWTTQLGGSYRRECHGVIATSDQGVLVVGSVGSASQEDNSFMTKLDEAGSVVWTLELGGDSADYFKGAVEVPGVGYVAVGGTNSHAEVRFIHLVLVDLNGVLQWERFIGNTADAGGTDVVFGHDGTLVFTGYNSLNLGDRDMILTMTDHDGWYMNGANYGDGRPADGYSVGATQDGGYVVAGWVEHFGAGGRSMYVVKTGADLLTESLDVTVHLEPVFVPEPTSVGHVDVYPNPARPGDQIWMGAAGRDGWVRLLDGTGRVVAVERTTQGSIVLPNVPDGLYTLMFQAGAEQTMRTPFVVNR